MTKILTHSILTIFSAVVISCTVAYGQNISFSSLTTENGLSNMTVNDIYIDEYGMVWIGTNYGLNRYNGHSIDVFHNEKGNPESIPSGNILRITGDQKGHVWVVCQTGIAEFDLNTARIRTIYKGDARSIYYDKDRDELYACVKRKILKWNPEKKRFGNALTLEITSAINDIVRSKDYMLIGTSGNGTWRMNMTNNALECIISTAHATRLYKDSKDNVWIGTWAKGLFKYDTEGNITSLRHDDKNPKSLSSDFVRCCCEDDTGKIWIGTILGLECYNPATGEITQYSNDKSAYSRLNHSSVWCTIKDKQGNIWIGTYYGGVNWFNPQHEVYTWYLPSTTEGKGLSSAIIGCIREDKKGNLWVATEGGGLNFIDRKTGNTRWYTTKSCGLSSNNIQSLYYEEDKDAIWVGTHLGGLNRLDIKSGRAKTYRFLKGHPNTLTHNIIKDILPYKDSLILATHYGLYMFDKVTGQRRDIFKGSDLEKIVKVVSKIFMDSKGNIWLTISNQGILRHNLQSGKTTLFKPSGEGTISDTNIYDIIEDEYGKIWLATANYGIDMFDPETEKFHNFDSQSYGLQSNRIYTFAKSAASRNILFTTSAGFCSFDPDTKSFNNYDKTSGFPMTDINDNSLYVTKDSTVFIGSIHGMVSFKEGSLNLTDKPYTITMSRLIVNGKEVKPGDESGILSKSLPATKSLKLKSGVSMFSIEFSASNYLSENKCDFMYRLEGLSDEWHTTRGQRIITFSRLPAGQYRLVIKPESHGISICPETAIDIKVMTPWYLTWYSCLLWLLLSVGLMCLLLRMYNNSLKLKQSIIYEQKKSQDIEALNQSKLRFFSNISHEIRTPLTVIIAQIETLMNSKDFTPATYKKALAIYQNSVQLKGLISELLEFRKQELGELKIKAGPHDIVKLISEFYLIFDEYAKAKNISFTLEKETNHLEVWYDTRQLQKVFRNLISNAIKYTDEGGEIKIFLGMKNNEMFFKISDTGCGISAEEREKIFTNFYRADKIDKEGPEGTGIGLALAKGIVEQHHGQIIVESEVGKGTSFIVTLPLGYSHFSPEQLEEENASENPINMVEVVKDVNVSKKTKTMLIVDDNDSIRKLLFEIFEPFYNILVAQDGELGWEIVKSQLPDIVVSDVLMPKLSGTELCRKIKTETSTCHIPVVLLTARVDIDQNIEGILTGADDYIAKPFNTKFLISRCNNLVNSRIILQEKFSSNPDMSSKMLATNPIDKNILDRAISIIEENIDNPDFNINIFAREMAMSRTNLFTKIKSITGKTPNEYIMTIKLKKGAYMLKNNPELSVTEISDKLGFSSAKYFSKCFNDLYHMRPSAYRNSKEN